MAPGLRALATLALVSCQGGDGARVFFVAPEGTGSACSEAQPCALGAVRDVVRAAGPVGATVSLRGGTYAITEPLAFGPEDSGAPGQPVVWRARPGEIAVLSGGRRLTGWQPDPARPGLFQAPVPEGAVGRQLFVDGVRAVRARGPQDPPGFTLAPEGFSHTDPALATWGNARDVEVVGWNAWKAFRCPVASLTDRLVALQAPCWPNARLEPGRPFDHVSWLENAAELLDEPGEWYLDRRTQLLAYRPRPGEDLEHAVVILAVTEELLVGAGTHDLRLQGLVFQHAGWRRPGEPLGYAPYQAGVTLVGSTLDDLAVMPAAVSFRGGHGIELVECQLRQLGAAALAFDGGTQDVLVDRNRFEDLSGGAIEIGDVREATDPLAGSARVVVRNNVVTRTGRDYPDTVAVFAGYTSGLRLVHNEIAEAPYTAISVGWGWDLTPDSRAHDNEVAYNLVHDYATTLRDAGGIYTLGVQRGSTVHHNYVHGQTQDQGALYLDEGTRFLDVHHNVVADAPRWLFIWTTTIQDNVVHDNYADRDALTNDGAGNTVTDNHVVAGGDWPAEARAIMAGAGPRP